MKENAFEQIAPQYALKERLSPHCIQSIIQNVSEQATTDLCSHLLDVGGGNGQFTSEFLCRIPIEKCTIIDASRRMLQEAREHFVRIGLTRQLKLVQGDAHALPVTSGYSSLVLMSFVLHLLSEPKAALLEVHRVLSEGGWFFLVTYDISDLRNQIYHKYFPGYYEIDARRYLRLDELPRIMSACGLRVVEVSKCPYMIEHRSVDEVVELVRSKPFSTFAKYSESKFREAIDVFEKRLCLEYGTGPVKYDCQVTLVSLVRATD